MDNAQYDRVCKLRFAELKEDIDSMRDDDIRPMRDDITYLKTKIDNGLSSLPKRVNWMLAILVGFLLGVISLVYITGRNQARMETLLEVYIEKVDAGCL